jgi:hypothetical protein
MDYFVRTNHRSIFYVTPLVWFVAQYFGFAHLLSYPRRLYLLFSPKQRFETTKEKTKIPQYLQYLN